jgi:hypothetical protein
LCSTSDKPHRYTAHAETSMHKTITHALALTLALAFAFTTAACDKKEDKKEDKKDEKKTDDKAGGEEKKEAEGGW